MIKDEKRDFDSEAASWDKEPGRVKLATEIAGAIRKNIALTSDMDVLDFGCGTGLVTLQLQPFIHSITGVDSSQGMIDVLEQKIAKKNLTNVKTRFFDMEKGDVLDGRYHLIVSSMTFHHIKEIKAIFDQFHHVVLPSGYLCIADLDSEGGLFHSDNRGVIHFGFDRDRMRQLFIEAGFDNVRRRTAATVMKPIHDGKMVEFTVFLMTGRKGV
jgi:Methylase involved in ubiquinone/menaquinone biosynthesis